MKKIFLGLLFAFLLAGCQDDASQKYIGAWKSIEGADTFLSIKKNGDNFLVTQYFVDSYCPFGPIDDTCFKDKKEMGTAFLQADGTLQISDFMPGVLNYIEEDKTLLAKKGAHLLGGTYEKAESLADEEFFAELRRNKKNQ